MNNHIGEIDHQKIPNLKKLCESKVIGGVEYFSDDVISCKGKPKSYHIGDRFYSFTTDPNKVDENHKLINMSNVFELVWVICENMGLNGGGIERDEHGLLNDLLDFLDIECDFNFYYASDYIISGNLAYHY